MLEEIFLDRVYHTNIRYTSKQHPGILLGQPVAFALIGLLRAHISDLMARTMMVAFSDVIMQTYENINGYMAVQLWEALTGEKVPAAAKSSEALHTYFLSRSEGILKPFREYPVKSWVDNVYEETVVKKIFEEKLKTPLIREQEYKKKNSLFGFPKNQAWMSNLKIGM